MHKIYNNISLAYRAKKLILGTDEIVRKMQRNSKMIILISGFASINTFKLIQNKVNTYGSELIILNDYENNLEKIFKGKKIKVMAIEDKDFKKLIRSNIKE